VTAKTRALGLALALVAACGGDDGAVDGGGDASLPPDCDGGALVTCPAATSRACTGPETPVTLADPVVDTRCGAPVGPFTSDAPPGGFEVGETTVAYTATAEDGTPLGCSTDVTITDSTPPLITCEPSVTVVRTSPDAAPTLPVPAVTDDCSEAPVFETSPPPEMLVRGDNAVTTTATDTAGLSAECSSNVEVLEAFAPEAFRIISAEITSDGTTDVTVAWDPAAGDDVTGYVVERASSDAGPWTALSMFGRARRTYTDDALADDQAYYRVRSLAGALEGGATPALRALSISRASYDLRGQAVPTVPFATTLYGVVRHPRDLSAGPYPLVLMLHGNHGICRRTPTSDDDVCATSEDHECPLDGYVTTPNAEGLAYLAETVAAQGFVAVTISANAINCRTLWIQERAQLIMEHLRRWDSWQRTSAAPFGGMFNGAVDTSRVALFGHSRGGEAVGHVPALMMATPIPRVRLSSVFALAPTDYDSPEPAGVPYAVVLPGCDGDVTTLVGSDTWDRSIRASDDFPRSQVLFAGANHNFFSTEWRVDDNTGAECNRSWEVGGAAQRGMLEGVFGAWLAGTSSAGGSLEPFFRGDADTPEGIDAWADEDLDLRWSYMARRQVIDEFEAAGTPLRNLLGEPNSYRSFETSSQCFDNGCGGRYPHEKGAMRLRWDGMTPVATIGLGGLDGSGYGYFSFRVVSRRSTFNSGPDQVFTVRLVDRAGVSAEVRTNRITRIPHLYPHNNPLEMFQSVRVPWSELTAVAPGFDPANLDRAELEFTVASHARGSVMISDFAVSD